MKIYKVGGAVRDMILGKEPKDIDYVVVGSSVEEMLSLGYSQVGVGFPVFLHPETKEEYALARTERKTGNGYTGFAFSTEAVTLEDDLLRRDLTINSIAMDEDGNIIDPHGGVKDLENKILRHTSNAFAEDPLRIIRLARFAARYNDFTIASNTVSLCMDMVEAEMLDEIPHERFWTELDKVMEEPHAEVFFEVLDLVGAFKCNFFTDVFGSYFGHFSQSLQNINKTLQNTVGHPKRLMILIALYGKPNEKSLVSSEIKAAVDNFIRYFNTPGLTAEQFYTLLVQTSAYRQGDTFDNLITVLEEFDNYQSIMLRAIQLVTSKVTSADFPDLTGKAIGEAIAEKRIKMIDNYFNA